jgi:hypothetical protein
LSLSPGVLTAILLYTWNLVIIRVKFVSIHIGTRITVGLPMAISPTSVAFSVSWLCLLWFGLVFRPCLFGRHHALNDHGLRGLLLIRRHFV